MPRQKAPTEEELRLKTEAEQRLREAVLADLKAEEILLATAPTVRAR